MLESYSRVMESLAFNIIARIDDVIYVDDAVKKCPAAEMAAPPPPPLFNVQKKISPSPFSVQETPYGTPAFCSSTPVNGSPGSVNGEALEKTGRLLARADVDRLWASYTAGELSNRKETRGGSSPDRDRA